MAQPPILPAPSLPVPSSLGTGISSRWSNGKNPADYDELDRALSFLTPESFSLEGVGPVSLSNNLAPLGDFANHAPMPYSTMGTPEDTGWYLVSRMTGAWAARQTGTYTFAVGADDGFRVTLAGVVLLEHAPSQPFRRQAASFVVSEVGLYPIVVEYFNGVQEGVIELSFTSGDVELTSVTAPLPALFQLIPVTDLYPPDALGGPGTVSNGDDAGPSLTATSGTAEAPPTDGTVPAEDHWHGGGCSVSGAKDPGAWFSGVLGALVASALLRRRVGDVQEGRSSREGA